MPLLKRKAFEKSTASGYLRDDDEVFHCEITDEIFKDYEEYCERIILVNSMVWTCEMTGKNNLTYAEALESEKAARRQLKDFPIELRIPILYLAMKTNRSSFAEMSEDIYNYVRERYFVGETVEACLEGDTWCEAHVLSVIAQKQQPGSKVTLPPSAYCYEVEQFQEAGDEGPEQIGTAPYDRVRRRKGIYTRDKNRLFLKQFVQQAGGVIRIKQSALDEYNISKVSYDQIFTGEPPDFPASKKLIKTSISPVASKNLSKPNSASKLQKSLKKVSPDKKGRQESMDKFLKKTDKPDGTKPKPPVNLAAKKSAQELAEKMRRAEELMRQRKEEEKAKKKEKAAQLQAYLKEWQKVKDDLDLEDHKPLPKGTTVDVEGIPHENFGDFLSVLEFVHVYSDVLKTKDVFSNGLDLETFRKCLTEKQYAGQFSDLIQMFLTTIFTLQEDEAEEYNESGSIEESVEVEDLNLDMNTTQAMELATKASKWCQTYLGTSLSKLPLDPTTVSEVLRLHLLSSGAAGGGRCAAWRYHQRGGYSSRDDAGLRLRVRSPRLLAALGAAHVAHLALEEKFQILQCLMNQVLSYATVRDIIEEKLEELRNTKFALRTLTINERKREVQVVAARQEIRKEAAAKKEELKLTGEKARAHDEQTKLAIEKLAKDSEVKKHEYEKKVKELQLELFDYTSYLGSDRAYRRYWVHQRVAGVFVEAGAESRGLCRDKHCPPARHAHRASSDKENESGPNSRGTSPKKPLGLNGLTVQAQASPQQLLLCSGDITTCFVHGKVDRPNWMVFHTEEQIEALIQALNKRGLRENDLRQALELDKDNIVEYLKKCPLHLLNRNAAPQPPPVHQTRHKKSHMSLLVPDDCTLSEALELSLRDQILELEEKIFHGCLGAIKVKDREAWRGTLMLRGYDKQAEYLSWGPARRYRDDQRAIDEDDGIQSESKYRDPGHYLGDSGGPAAVRDLASALLQVEQSIHQKHIRRPLGFDEKERKEREAKNKSLELEALERWEVSLMQSKSFAQVSVHLVALDACVAWTASVLRAACRICRRRGRAHHMLLCDSCNLGHHLHCLRPQLTKVPEGDWFCDQCRPKEQTPRKKRKLFTEEELEESPNDDSLSDDEGVELSVCGECGSGGRLRARCAPCGRRLHAECAPCSHCRAPARGVRRSATAAASTIQRYARSLHAAYDSEDSDDDKALVKLKSSRSKLTNGTKRTRRSKENSLDTSTRKRTKTSLTNGDNKEERLSNGSGPKRRRVRGLSTESLQQLLREALKHKDSWPFYRPVSLEEVPDYLDVIEQPMDLSTIQEKLAAGEYLHDAEVLQDISLVFENCHTYNPETHLVAKAGLRLEQYLNKRCLALDLPPLPHLADSEDNKRAQ